MKKRIITWLAVFLMAFSIALPIGMNFTAATVQAASAQPPTASSHTHKYVRKIDEWKNPSDWYVKRERLMWKECSCGKRQGAREYWAYYNGAWHYMWNM